MTLEAHAKWLRKAAQELRTAGHAGWGNTCEAAADAIESALAPRVVTDEDVAIACGAYLNVPAGHMPDEMRAALEAFVESRK